MDSHPSATLDSYRNTNEDTCEMNKGLSLKIINNMQRKLNGIAYNRTQAIKLIVHQKSKCLIISDDGEIIYNIKKLGAFSNEYTKILHANIKRTDYTCTATNIGSKFNVVTKTCNQKVIKSMTTDIASLIQENQALKQKVNELTQAVISAKKTGNINKLKDVKKEIKINRHKQEPVKQSKQVKQEPEQVKQEPVKQELKNKQEDIVNIKKEPVKREQEVTIKTEPVKQIATSSNTENRRTLMQRTFMQQTKRVSANDDSAEVKDKPEEEGNPLLRVMFSRR